MSEFASRLESLKALIRSKDRKNVRIIAVSKTHPPDSINELLRLGQLEFGENRLNEGRAKLPFLRGRPILHHIGPFQKSGARIFPGVFQYAHGISDLEALDKLLASMLRYADQHPDDDLLPARYLIQVKLTGEASKLGGMEASKVLNLSHFPENSALRMVGFMTMGPESLDEQETRETFQQLREIRNKCLPGGELSMGMSSDLKIALEEGATMIRPGSLLFGPRQGAAWRPD